ncbi:hypothetical protein HPP92_018596 [Vanilla planifolia]|uniref:DNA topoisomerase (ATP-hydrolyzing) n=1 Tax=Vanilla planifolia TaxID=51239 RepID=A0A835Q609_VANPL|nr:hypothetical protein HPP92_018596 [Vanilla planifolia]
MVRLVALGGEELMTGKDLVLCSSDILHKINGIILKVLLIVQKLHQEHKHVSKRDIYYMEPSLFIDQGCVDQAIRGVCMILKCSRHHLNIVPAGRGLVMGWLRFVESGRTISCIKSPNTAYSIPACVEEVEVIESVAQYILVVEKETVLQRLANDNFCKTNLCILITGRGYPDVTTRRFLRLLMDQLHIPAYCLVDYDPHGFDILSNYRFGSMQMAYDAKLMRVPEIRWLGVFHSDLAKYQPLDRCLLSLTSEEKKKAESMLLRCNLQQEAPRGGHLLLCAF